MNILLRSALFAVFTIAGFAPFVLMAKKSGIGWPVPLLWGAVCFAAVFYVQVPIQSWIRSELVGSGIPEWARRTMFIIPSGIVQEFAKALLPILLLLVGLRLGTPRTLFGPAAGAGFGLTEAIYLVALPAIPLGWAAFAERFSAIFLHIGLSSIAVGNGRVSKFVWGLPLAMLAHSGINILAITIWKGNNIIFTEAVIAFVSLVIWICALIINGKGE